MPKVRFKNVNSVAARFNRVLADACAERLDSIAPPFLERLKRRFNGQDGYPGKILGRAKKSIYVRRRGKYLIEYGTRGPVAMRIPWLSESKLIQARNVSRLAIPISMEAKRHASRGKSARDFHKKLDVAVRESGGEKMVFLVQKSGAAAKKATGKDLIFHYYLTDKIFRPAFKGLDDAVEELMPWIQKQLIGKRWI